jgi:eukaryotic-like serine/threonine-protein kinase
LIGTVAADRFLVLDRIGGGGMGSIYRAYQLSIGRYIALKVLSARRCDDPEFAERFSREAKLTAQLRSPHTITLYDFGELESGELFMAMELIPGRSLEQVFEDEAPLEASRVAKIASQICVALEEAHALGLIHRDIKPSNVMLDRTGRIDESAKVLDFGLAKAIDALDDSLPPLTRPGMLCGTPPFMAPELWNTSFGEVGPAVDIYALGAVMFEMLTGRQVFDAKSVPSMLQKHMHEAPPSIRELNPAAAALDPIIQRCLAKHANDRYASARALRADLERLIEKQPGFLLLAHEAQRESAELGRPAPPAAPKQVDVATLIVRERKPPEDAQPVNVEPMPPPIAPIAVRTAETPIPSVILPPATRVTPSFGVSAVRPIAIATLMLASAVAALAGAVVYLLRAPAPEREIAEPRVVAPAPPAPPRAPPAVLEREVKQKAARKSRAPRMRITDITTVGEVDGTAARRAIDQLAPAFTRCAQQAPVATSFSLYFLLDGAGRPQTIKATPEHAATVSYVRCVEPHARAQSFPIREGARFAALRLTVEP